MGLILLLLLCHKQAISTKILAFIETDKRKVFTTSNNSKDHVTRFKHLLTYIVNCKFSVLFTTVISQL